MTPQTSIIKLRLRLNKLHSQDYDNIEDWKAIEAINKAALEWTRKQIHGSNRTQEGDEETRVRVDDLQFLLTEKKIEGNNKELFFESDTVPSDYLWFKNIIPTASSGHCSGVLLESTLIEESNVPVYLFDWSMSPSFDFRQTFHTIVSNRIRIYTNGDFLIDSAQLMYYRRPAKMDIAGYTHEDATISSNKDLEFKDDIAELIIDEAASILAGDVENYNTAQNTKQRADNNN